MASRRATSRLRTAPPFPEDAARIRDGFQHGYVHHAGQSRDRDAGDNDSVDNNDVAKFLIWGLGISNRRLSVALEASPIGVTVGCPYASKIRYLIWFGANSFGTAIKSWSSRRCSIC